MAINKVGEQTTRRGVVGMSDVKEVVQPVAIEGQMNCGKRQSAPRLITPETVRPTRSIALRGWGNRVQETYLLAGGSTVGPRKISHSGTPSASRHLCHHSAIMGRYYVAMAELLVGNLDFTVKGWTGV